MRLLHISCLWELPLCWSMQQCMHAPLTSKRWRWRWPRRRSRLNSDRFWLSKLFYVRVAELVVIFSSVLLLLFVVVCCCNDDVAVRERQRELVQQESGRRQQSTLRIVILHVTSSDTLWMPALSSKVFIPWGYSKASLKIWWWLVRVTLVVALSFLPQNFEKLACAMIIWHGHEWVWASKIYLCGTFTTFKCHILVNGNIKYEDLKSLKRWVSVMSWNS